MQDSLRKSFLPLTLFGPLAVAAGVATFKSSRTFLLSAVQLTLTDSGVGAGNTTAVLKKNGVAIATVSVAGAAASVTSQATVNGQSPAVYPAGTAVAVGDVLTVDITAVPGTTPPKGGHVILDIVQTDI